MECTANCTTVANTSTLTSSSPGTLSPSRSLSPPTHPASPVIVSPCAACKFLRRRCAEKCVLAPYFPPTDPAKFAIAHRVFGASNIIKFLQDLPESQRADAVASMVYEASARVRDPVYGCAGAICHLQKQVSELQAQLAKAQAEMVNMRCRQEDLMAMLCMEMAAKTSQPQIFQHLADGPLNSPDCIHQDIPSFLDEPTNPNMPWEQMMLWT
ncbi:hypothetical protein SAY87_005495 [Trapa incisa]|uniref:LOB domain-containing protein n=1 Tax=Trapa incisa TaxID=236973 RepID=A0AAN7K6J9_9MYRT|nr:hypothetical protein SAY87_005495 [Trapa incisa]